MVLIVMKMIKMTKVLIRDSAGHDNDDNADGDDGIKREQSSL